MGSGHLGSADEVTSLLQHKVRGPLAGRVPHARHGCPAHIGHPRHPPWQNHDGSSQSAWLSSLVNIKQMICATYMAVRHDFRLINAPVKNCYCVWYSAGARLLLGSVMFAGSESGLAVKVSVFHKERTDRSSSCCTAAHTK